MYGLIYCAQNLINEKRYIGQTILSLERRKTYHKGYVRNGAQTYFHRAIRKYGFDGFDWSILTKENNEGKLNKAEKYWIETLETMNPEYGYNLCSGGKRRGMFSEEVSKQINEKMKGEGNPFLGRKHTKESIELIKIALRGKKYGPMSEEHKEKIRLANKGKKRTKETLRKMSAANKGKKLSEEHKLKIGLAGKGEKNHNFGKKISEEQKKKLSEALSGIKHPMYGKKHTEESIELMSVDAKKRWSDPKYKEKMIIAAKKRWENYHGRNDN